MSEWKRGPSTAQFGPPAAVAAAGSVLVGLLLTLQSHVTGALAQFSGDIAGSALITVGVGGTVLALFVFSTTSGRESVRATSKAVRRHQLPFWAFLGGVGGAFFVVVQGAAAAPLGLAVFVMAVVAGQLGGGLLFDWWGMTDGIPRPVTWARIAGALGACAAVWWSAAGESSAPRNPLLAALAFLGGVSIAWSSGANGRVQRASLNAATAALVNHTIAVASMLLLCAAQAILRPQPFVLPAEPWMFSGGLLGVLVTLLVVKLVSALGVLRLALGIVAGQVGGGLLSDAFITREGVSPVTLGAAGITLAAVAVASIPSPRRPQPVQPSGQD